MYLKSIEVQGFKSFANKITFDFHNGITGIVGPNGSGKSNVADAVRWVLGEQRIKQLRGGTMQDVIFSGTENRRPLSYASVAITLDNSDHQLSVDYDEVTVTRKLYRSGESEYLINGRICRLKDVNELFYDTGIGKEGYSIIGQGQIDKIISGKPEERRELFDEAAGIVKFKRRKTMSVRKLEDERANLVRVNDILSELEKQKGPLEKQSETAKIYLKKKEELKTYDINMFLLETLRLKGLSEESEKKLGFAKDQFQNVSTRYETMKSEYEAVEEATSAIDDEIEDYKNKLNETNLLKQQHVSKIEILKEQIRSAKMSDEHYEQRSKMIEKEIETREIALSELEKDSEEIRSELLLKRQEEANAKEKLVDVQSRMAEEVAKTDQDKKNIIELLNSRASTKAKIQKFDTMLEQIEVRKADMSRRLFSAKSLIEVEEEDLKKYQDDLKSISGEILKLTEERSGYESEISEIQKQLSAYTNNLGICQNQFHKEHSRLESLKNITERYDGYGNSIRRVMEHKKEQPGLLGVVADLIKVDKEYETAIETALGGSIQNIVTDNEETAKRMIDFLKRSKAGRATFLPLTAINGKSGITRPEALKEPGVIALADELVTVDTRYRKLAAHLLGRTVVVDNIDHGIAISRKYKQTLRLVTLDGELLNPGGSMTGGAFKNAGNLLGRRREIEELEKNVESLKCKVKDAEEQCTLLRQKKADHYARVDAIQEELQKAFVVQNTAKMNVDQSQTKINDAKRESQKVVFEKNDLEKEISEIKENQESIQVELDTSQNLEEELSGKIEAAEGALEELKKEEMDSQSQVEHLRMECAAMEQKQEFSMENRVRIDEEITRFKEELQTLGSSKENASLEMKEKEEQILKIQQIIKDSEGIFDEIKEEINQAIKKKEELTQQHRTFLKQREECSKSMSDLDKEIFRLETKKEEYENALDAQIDYMWEEYEITYNHALELRNESFNDLSDMKKQIIRIKGEIRALGSVNVNAIEDYKNLSERYEFLKNQHDDLIEAEASLVKIIEELDEAMRKQFVEQFARIAKEFDQVFKELFGGGKGTLELLEDEDILEAGIRIIAQPPGKKLQNMMQLSGGEKALTAISLLFAIQNLKPSPFCLLDEIEAALDDSNVTRFAQYLHKLTKNTQFIVITHRRGTMTAADRLYGITMQEKGVSTLVSVSLLENELDK